MSFHDFSLADLKDLLRSKGMKTSGNKIELIARLQEQHVKVPKECEETAAVQEATTSSVATVERLQDEVGSLQRAVELLTQRLQAATSSSPLPGEQTNAATYTASCVASNVLENHALYRQPTLATVPYPANIVEIQSQSTIGADTMTPHIAASQTRSFVLPTSAQTTSVYMQPSMFQRPVSNTCNLPPLFAASIVPTYPQPSSVYMQPSNVQGKNSNLQHDAAVPMHSISLPTSAQPTSGLPQPSMCRLPMSNICNMSHASTGFVLSMYTTSPAMLPNSIATNNSCTNLNPFNNVRDITSVMPDFDPCNGDVTSIQFLERVQQLQNAYGWDEKLLIFAVQSKMKGSAKLWIDAQPIFRGWEEFVNAFLTDFPSIINSADIHMQMMNTRMSRNETLIDFYYKLLAIGRRGNVDDISIIRYFINGLFDDGLRKTLSAMNFAKCSDLLQSLLSVDSNYKKPINCFAQPQAQLNPKNANTFNNRNNNFKNENKENQKTGPICYNCRERGHLSRNCPVAQRNPKCQKCLSSSHDTQNCPSRVAPRTQAPVNIIENNLEKKKYIEIVKDIKVNGVECRALIDSGSCKSLISRSVANKCNGTVSECNETLEGFGGGKWQCREIMSVTVTIDGHDYENNFNVINDDMIKYNAIIGTDILSQGRVIIENGNCKVIALGTTKVDVGDTLNSNEKNKLMSLFNLYCGCFGENLKDIGKCGSIKMEISLTSSKPIVKRPYPVPIPKQQTVEKIISDLLTQQIIRPSNSLYASPIVLVRKQNGEDRLCVDYRELNAITEKQPWSMPTVDGVFSTLAGKKFFTTLDLMSGYYQVEISEESKQFTAFVTHNGHFEFNRMPFGLRNAPSTFQRMMSQVIKPMKDKIVSYVDEVIVASKSFEDGLRDLEEFLKIIQQQGLTLRLSKCSFLKNKVTFLGHELDENGLTPGKIKTIAIQQFPVPKSALEVRRFLGLTGFFRKFVANYAQIAAPLTRLTRKYVNFHWATECNDAFQQLVQILSVSPVLGVYDVNKEHQVHTDACSIGIAAILLQREENGALKPIAYYSRLCNDAERNYHGYEIEVLAVVEGCQRFRMYILGKRFTIVTDCQAITSLKSSKPLIPRVARWFMKLLEYDYEAIHRPGTSMAHVDAMSRAPVEAADEPEDVSVKVMTVGVTVDDWIFTLQKQDPKLLEIINILTDKLSKERDRYKDEYMIKNNRLLRKAGENLLLVIPRGMRWRIVRLCHDESGHPGADGTLKRIARHFWFPRRTRFVKGYIKSCVECCYSRDSRRKECELYGMDTPRVPFEVLHLDHLGPFVRSRRANEHILVIVDALTRYSVIVPVKSTKTKPVIDAMQNLTSTFGLPKIVVTDRGTSFTSAVFEEFCSVNDIHHIKVAVRTPRANGLAERINQSVLAYLRASTSDAKDWDLELRRLQWTLNTNINSTTKLAPMDLVYDFRLRDISGNRVLAALHDDDNSVENINMHERRQEAINNIQIARVAWKSRFDAKHKKPRTYSEGDLVLLESAIPSTGESRKLDAKFRGPYSVAKVLRFDRYLIEDIDGAERSQRKFSTVASSDKMKPWCELYPDIDDDYDDDADDNYGSKPTDEP